MRLLCLVQAKSLCRYGCMYFLAALVLVYADAMVVIFNVCSAVTVECCLLYPCCVGVFCMFAGM